MDSKEFKILFSEIAKVNGFGKSFGGWFNESDESIVVLDLQKSNFGDYYELNIKIYIQGMLGKTYTKNKDLVKKDVGDVFRRYPPEYRNVFDCNSIIEDAKRKKELEKLFNEFIIPITNKALTRQGIKELAEQGIIFLLPAIKEELS